MMDELDFTQLAAPAPFERALAAAEALAPGQAVAIIAPMLPRPLLAELAALGFDAEPQAAAADGSVRVIIRRPDDAQAQA